MAVKIRLASGEYICSSCGAVVPAEAEDCEQCGSPLKDTVEESENFKVVIQKENEDDTQKAVKIFRMLSGSSILDPQYLGNIITELENSGFPERVSRGLLILKYYVSRYQNLNDNINELIKRMKKEKKDEILSDLDTLQDLEKQREEALDKIRDMQVQFSELLDAYNEFITKKETALKGRIEEFQKDVERRKLQAKMLLEKEKELLEREHKLRERERLIEKELASIESSAKKLEGTEITKEEWMAAQREIQEKLYKIREEVIKKRESSEKDKLVREVLKVLDTLLGKLPDEIIEEFAMSKDFELYKKVMEMYGLGGGSGSS
ncbi:MAG: hypothetical protein GXO25_00370 [Euryarchaeota archaeon]|nr:hypothetical protein [Euryarchaeota archaeon]